LDNFYNQDIVFPSSLQNHIRG